MSKEPLLSNRDDTGNVYDVYSLNGTLLKSAFITSPNGSSTGIAYDGTNYYTDNVYDRSFNVFDSNGVFVKTIGFTGASYVLGEDLSVNYSQVLTGGVPEPSTWAMMFAGMLGLVAISRRRAAAAPRPS